jgi:predicted DCC family thiol-disulfide oxidoreductase YuxK
MAVGGEPLPPALASDESGLPPKLMIFDGVCVLCNGGVRFVLRRERQPDFSFAPVQSALGQRVLAALGQPLDGNASMVVIHAGRYFLKSDAVVETARGLKAPWSWAAGVRFLPKRWRDRAYELLARNRYNVFGRYDTCMVPDATMKTRFPE